VTERFFTSEFQDAVDEFVRENCMTFADVSTQQINGEDNNVEYDSV
jgi:hypothetical protein